MLRGGGCYGEGRGPGRRVAGAAGVRWGGLDGGLGGFSHFECLRLAADDRALYRALFRRDERARALQRERVASSAPSSAPSARHCIGDRHSLELLLRWRRRRHGERERLAVSGEGYGEAGEGAADRTHECRRAEW